MFSVSCLCVLATGLLCNSMLSVVSFLYFCMLVNIYVNNKNNNGGGVTIYVNTRTSENFRSDSDCPLLKVVAVEIISTRARSYVVMFFRIIGMGAPKA